MTWTPSRGMADWKGLSGGRPHGKAVMGRDFLDLARADKGGRKSGSKWLTVFAFTLLQSTLHLRHLAMLAVQLNRA